MRHTLTLLTALLALVGSLHAEREFFVFDNGLSDIKSAGEQAVLLEKLGYDGICTRPQNADDELFTAMDQHGIEISATYVTLQAEGDEPLALPGLADHLSKLKGRKTFVWLVIGSSKASDHAAVSVIRKVCDLSAENGLEVVLYPHVGSKTNNTAECERLRKLVERSNLGISFNLCHYLCQDDPAGMEAALKAVAPNLKLVQISGADELPPGKPDWQRLIQPLGQGTFDVRRVLRALEQIGYKGPVNLQCFQIKQPAGKHLAASMEAWKKLKYDLTRERARDACRFLPPSREFPLATELGSILTIGGYKGDAVPGPKQKPAREMLFNLATDITEQHNLAAEQAAKLAELKKLYAAWSEEVDADCRKTGLEPKFPKPVKQGAAK